MSIRKNLKFERDSNFVVISFHPDARLFFLFFTSIQSRSQIDHFYLRQLYIKFSISQICQSWCCCCCCCCRNKIYYFKMFRSSQFSKRDCCCRIFSCRLQEKKAINQIENQTKSSITSIDIRLFFVALHLYLLSD